MKHPKIRGLPIEFSQDAGITWQPLDSLPPVNPLRPWEHWFRNVTLRPMYRQPPPRRSGGGTHVGRALKRSARYRMVRRQPHILGSWRVSTLLPHEEVKFAERWASVRVENPAAQVHLSLPEQEA